MSPSNPSNHRPRLRQHTVLLASDSKSSVLAEVAGCINHMAYFPYGQQSAQQKVMTHVGFNGELREARTDWYFLGNGYRVYNPRLMHFHSPDKFSPFGKGGLNAYAYCGCEPVMRTDPTGEGWVFKAFAFFNELFSGVGPTGASTSRSATLVKPAEKKGWFLGAMEDAMKNSQAPFHTPSRKVPLGKSRRPNAERHYPPSYSHGISNTPETRQANEVTGAQNPTVSRNTSVSSFSSGYSWTSDYESRLEALKRGDAPPPQQTKPSGKPRELRNA
ncbi:RHS repeat-associated core domain-containing protein [Pseudomonas sp. PSB11]|uniref:RHS repeat-associated core domain-containing protein n=1 Tax=Pseudomonas sp. PSB11 TaxID=2021969 RepID=UPI001660EAB7|nr:RHS repeat-associated core domain-containing protein [Pseudomonas sp. PSB11]